MGNFASNSKFELGLYFGLWNNLRMKRRQPQSMSTYPALLYFRAPQNLYPVVSFRVNRDVLRNNLHSSL